MNISRWLFVTLILMVLAVAGGWIINYAVQWSENRVESIQENLARNVEHITKTATATTNPGFIRDMLKYTENIVYTKDSRTNLCFAWQYRRMSNVPCHSIPEGLLYNPNPPIPAPDLPALD